MRNIPLSGFENPKSEAEALNYLNEIFSKNRIFKSWIGQDITTP
jgi:glycine cleavage system pyridoxal-binding protein P